MECRDHTVAMMHARISPATLGVVRFWVFAVWLGIIVADDFQQLAALPLEMFEPYGILKLVPATVWTVLLTPAGLHGLKLVLISLLGLTVLGVRPYRPIALMTVALITLHQGIVRGYGFINHAELGILYAAYVLAVVNAAEGFAVSRQKEGPSPPAVRSLAMVLITLLPLLAYSGIALFRVAHAGPDIFVGDSMLHYIGRSTFRGSLYGMNWGTLLFQHPEFLPLINAGFAVVTLFEIVSPLCLVSRRLRVCWLCVIVPFHMSTLLLMNIFFWENLLLFMVTMVDIEDVVQRLSRVLRKSQWPSISTSRRMA